jgi:phthiocerol/phenolphthiocerol synthesis type-I polyketide synthase C
MDTFACARRKNGRPALSVQWGPFADVGLAAADENRGSRLAQQGIESLSAEEGWGALRSFLIEDQKVVAYMPLDIRQWFDAFPQCVTQKIWEALRRSTKPGTKLSSTNEFLPELRSADGSEREHMVVQRIKEIAAKVLRMDAGEINAYIPFKSLGVDSLMAIEMRNRLESAFEVRLSITVLWTYGSVAELAPAMLERVTERWAEHTLAQVADPDPE